MDPLHLRSAGISVLLAFDSGEAEMVHWGADLGETLPDLGIVVHIGGGSLLVSVAVALLAVALAPLLSARRISRMDVPSTLRVME